MEKYIGGILAYARIKHWTKEKRLATFVFKPRNASRFNMYEKYPLSIKIDNLLMLFVDDGLLFRKTEYDSPKADRSSFKALIEDFYHCQVAERGKPVETIIHKESYVDDKILLYKFSTKELNGHSYRSCVNGSLYPYVRLATFNNDAEQVKGNAKEHLERLNKVGYISVIRESGD